VKKVLFFIDASFRALGPTSVKAAQLANNVDDILAEFATCNILKAFLKFGFFKILLRELLVLD